MAEPEVLYNFGVLTKRYELVSRTASQLAPGIAGLSVGFLMILAGAPLPLPFAPVLVGFWFALGKIPFGRHRGARVRGRGRTARPLLGSATRRQDPLGDARHVVERGGRPGRHQHARPRAAGPRPRRSSSRAVSEGIGEAEEPRHGVAERVRERLRAVAPRARPAALDGGDLDGAEAGLLLRAGRTPEPSHRGDLGVGRRPVRVLRTRRAGGADIPVG